MKRTAEVLAKQQREISVAEFFERNRHLLGFDNKRKALLTVVKETVDNSLDACEEAGILPEIQIEIIEMSKDRFRIRVEDNGPGIVKKQIPNIFAKLLYGSKFHKMRQSRGQQGIGVSAAVLYSQLTTGRPAKITSKTGKEEKAHFFELRIDTSTNKPEIIKEEKKEWNNKEHGTRIELDIEATYQKGDQSVDAYIKETAIVNPHITLTYTTPKAEQFIFAKVIDELPREPKEIKPHPYGVELGIMQKMLKISDNRSLQKFLTNEFSRVGIGIAKEICDKAGLFTNMKPGDLNLPQIEKLMESISQTKIRAPSTDCIEPIGAELLEKGLKKEFNAEFYAAITRSPTIYRGIPFVIECALAYGGEQQKEGSIKLLRFANRVPLLFQQGSGAVFKGVIQTNWRSYGLSQSNGSLPQGPLTLAVHIASVWPPFTSEAKEAIAHYPEIIKEIKLAVQECGRKLGIYIHKKKRINAEEQKRSYIETYIPFVGEALKDILDLNQNDEIKIESLLKEILEQERGKIKKITVENPEYDKEFAKIGQKNKGEIDEENL